MTSRQSASENDDAIGSDRPGLPIKSRQLIIAAVVLMERG